MSQDQDARFWNAVEKIETDYIADCDTPRFRRRMRRKGFDSEVIEERVREVNDAASAFSGRPE